MFMELILVTERKLRNVSILKLFTTANNQDLGNQFYSFTAKSCIDTFKNFFPYLCFYFQVHLFVN